MKWIYKAIAQKIFSYLPFGGQLNYFFQLHVTKSIPVPANEVVNNRGRRAIEHLTLLRQHTNLDISTALLFEFGAGSDLPQPLIFYMAGVNKQLIVDIEAHAKPRLVNDMIQKLNNCGTQLFEKINIPFRSLGEPCIASTADLQTHFGIEYKAPADARKTGLPANSVDCCTNTFTLEHIPAEDIKLIFKELYRILKPGGIASCFVDMNDHYAYFDKNINIYNFLSIDKTKWRWINSSVHYQNRLRHPDYLAIYKACGFEVIYEELKLPDERHAAYLKNTRLSKDFINYTPYELGIRSAKTLLRKV